MGVGLDELPDREAVRGFAGGDGDVLAHKLVSLFDSFPRDQTVTLVARQKSWVGYDSAPRLAARFKKRFWHSPTAIRGIPENIKS